MGLIVVEGKVMEIKYNKEWQVIKDGKVIFKSLFYTDCFNWVKLHGTLTDRRHSVSFPSLHKY